MVDAFKDMPAFVLDWRLVTHPRPPPPLRCSCVSQGEKHENQTLIIFPTCTSTRRDKTRKVEISAEKRLNGWTDGASTTWAAPNRLKEAVVPLLSSVAAASMRGGQRESAKDEICIDSCGLRPA
jgi:hypothetical protein